MNKQQKNYSLQQPILSTLSLFTSLGTVMCCALPALLVTIGAGATLAGLVSSAPWLVTLSKYKVWTFGISGIMMLIAGTLLWRSRNAPCPTDPIQAKSCQNLRQFSTWVYWISVLIWFIGFFFAFLAVHIFY